MKDQATLTNEIQVLFTRAKTSERSTAQIHGFMITIYRMPQESYTVCLRKEKKHPIKAIRVEEEYVREASEMMAAKILSD